MMRIDLHLHHYHFVERYWIKTRPVCRLWLALMHKSLVNRKTILRVCYSVNMDNWLAEVNDRNTRFNRIIGTLLFLGDLCDIAVYLINLGSWYLCLPLTILHECWWARANLALAFTHARPHMTPFNQLRSREFRQPMGETLSRAFARYSVECIFRHRFSRYIWRWESVYAWRFQRKIAGFSGDKLNFTCTVLSEKWLQVSHLPGKFH